jgi:hypothetical protein
MKTIIPESDCVLEHAAAVRTSNSSLPLRNFFLFIRILYLYYCIFMNKTGNISTNVTATRVRVNIVAVEKQ